MVCGCESEPPLAEGLQPDAVKAAQQRGSSELECPAGTAEVLRKEAIQEPQGTGWYEPPHRAVYTVNVTGCEKRATYLVTCDNRNRACAAGAPQKETKGSAPRLADELQPDAVKSAQQLGSSELECPAATAEVLRKETIEEPQGTGWYEPPHRAVYTVNVSGCEKRTTYLVSCDKRNKACAAGVPQKETTGSAPQLADKLQPGALKAAQQRGSSELECPAATAEVLRKETIQEPQGTGWYDPPHRAVYTVNVSGCEKRTTYLVSCDNRKKACVAGTLRSAER